MKPLKTIKMKSTLFFLLKFVILFNILFVMYFVSHFSIGTQEAWQEAVGTRFWEFFFSRLSVTFSFGLVFFLISLFLNKFIKNTDLIFNLSLKKLALIELACIFIASIIFVLIAIIR